MEKTLRDIAQALQNEVFSELSARRRGLLQDLDPRMKLATILALIGAAGLLRHVWILFLYNLWILWLARSSCLPLRSFVKRIWIAVFLFTGLVAFPALFNVVRPGTLLLMIWHFSHPVHIGFWTIPQEVGITVQGTVTATLLLLRAGASVSLAVLLTLTTRWSDLLKAFRVFRIPGVFIAVLEMAYRYVFLLLQIANEMFMARMSRTVSRTNTRDQRRFVTSTMGNLWSRAHATSEEVHFAMLARGYSGIPRSLTHFQMKRSDWLWAILILGVIFLFLGGDRVFG